MIVLEHDAKELLAIQGFPVPGGIQLTQVPKVDKDSEDEKAGPWIVKPQLPHGGGLAHSALVATSSREVADATAQLLGKTIHGHSVQSVHVEREMDSIGTARLSFACDPPSAGIRVAVAATGDSGGGQDDDTGADSLSEVAVPDPNAVIACVNKLVARLPAKRRNPVLAAARQLAPLFFGYEALRLEIDPLLILSDGTWTAGDVAMDIDENALFRHPEIISMIERREQPYRDVRRKRQFGLDWTRIDPDGPVGLIAIGAGLGMITADALAKRGRRPTGLVNVDDAALETDPAPLAEALAWAGEAATVRCISFVAFEGRIDLKTVAGLLRDALEEAPGSGPPIVACLLGSNSKQAAAAFKRLQDRVTVTEDLDAAIDLTVAASATPADAP